VDDILCNEAYDKLLTQEFNPKIEDFEECVGSDVEGDAKESSVKAKGTTRPPVKRFTELNESEVELMRRGRERKSKHLEN
jgi:hypothetical protein